MINKRIIPCLHDLKKMLITQRTKLENIFINKVLTTTNFNLHIVEK